MGNGSVTARRRGDQLNATGSGTRQGSERAPSPEGPLPPKATYINLCMRQTKGRRQPSHASADDTDVTAPVALQRGMLRPGVGTGPII